MSLGPFFRNTFAQLVAREWRLPMLLLLLLLGGTQALLVLAPPGAGGQPGRLFAVAGLARLVGAIWISVAALRLAVGGNRGPWSADAAFLFFGILSLFAGAVAIVAAGLTERFEGVLRIALVEGIAIAVLAAFAPWFVAAAVEKPTALSPLPWLRRFGQWLPHYLVLALLVGLPIIVAHGALSMALQAAAGGSQFWPLAAADALVSTVSALFILALRVSAYRSVAQG